MRCSVEEHGRGNASLVSVLAHRSLYVRCSEVIPVKVREVSCSDALHFGKQFVWDSRGTAKEPEGLGVLLLARVYNWEVFVISLDHFIVWLIDLLAEEWDETLSAFGVGAGSVSVNSEPRTVLVSCLGRVVNFKGSFFGVQVSVLSLSAWPAIGLEGLP